MKKHNQLDERKKELVNTGLCNTFDFIPEHKTIIENYTFEFDMDKEAKKILLLAHSHFGLKDIHLERIERITKAIMKLDNVESCDACHIAEAIQYLNFK